LSIVHSAVLDNLNQGLPSGLKTGVCGSWFDNWGYRES